VHATDRRRASYGAFLTGWQDADPGVPVPIEARRECSKSTRHDLQTSR
jgi:hypothetical protein